MGRGIGPLLVLAALLLVPGYALWTVPAWSVEWALLLLVPSVLSFGQYAWDKRLARLQRWRVPEAQLHLLDLLAGWPGGFLAQHWLRHKTAKAGFQFVFWLIVGAEQIALVLWLMH